MINVPNNKHIISYVFFGLLILVFILYKIEFFGEVLVAILLFPLYIIEELELGLYKKRIPGMGELFVSALIMVALLTTFFIWFYRAIKNKQSK